MMRHPVVISSLEEDFEQIGLTESKKPEAEDTDADSLEEARVARRRAAGGKVAKKTQRSSQKEKRASKGYYRKHKASILRRRKKKMKSAKVKRRMAWLRAHEGTEQPTPQSSLVGILEDVQKIVSQIDEGTESNDLDTTIRSFANIAIISEMLSDFFGSITEDTELSEELEAELMEDVASAHKFFAELAETAAEVATDLSELDEDEEIVAEELEKVFQEQMDALVDGLEFYADLTESSCDDEDEDEEDDEDMEEAVEESAEVPSFRERMASARRKMDR